MLKFLLISTCLTSLAFANPNNREITYQVANLNVSKLPTFERPAVCKLPHNVGTGAEKLERWYFDESYNQCDKFTYKGKDGNENKFASEAECLTFCVENPCPSGIYSSTDGQRQSCTFDSIFNKDNCTADSYCIIPHNICCQKDSAVVDICTQPKDEGRFDVNNVVLPSHLFFFNSKTNKCETFQYNGLGGGYNMFKDKKSCINACKLPNVCPDNHRPLANAHGPIGCQSNSDCPHKNFVCTKGFCCPQARTLTVSFDGSIALPKNSAISKHIGGFLVSIFLLALYL